ncbi:unnamed protein product [Effrenium voratum]|uniref:diacylglycerol kinase (ATP) n=1 Tax=Effrenium voratum TaxID=2562239 RepID=A0AA36HRI1_9DINO|nr:unnamed protein product [Effrenium voratum]
MQGPAVVPYDADLEHVFLFVNPKAGGQLGDVFLQIPQPFDVRIDPTRRARLHVFSLTEGKSGNKPGFHFLRQVLMSYAWVRVFVGGGDGTVMWVVSEAQKHGVHTETGIRIGMVPLGTGNDFSQALGWGGRNPDADALLKNDCAGMRDLMQDWIKAETELHDIWRISLKVDEEDGFLYNKDTVLTDADGSEQKSLDSHMLLYCGIAKDAELAYNVELRRTKSQCLNKLVYIWQGAMISLHFFCCVGQRVQRVLRGLYHGTSRKGEPIFEVGVRSKGPRLYSNPEMLLCLNINSYGGGVARNLWNNSWRNGTSQPLMDDLLELDQDPGDKQLEVMTLSRLLRAAMPTNSVLGGRRVFQGAPLHFEFKQRNYRDLITFFQVDGESYKLQNPVSLTIEHNQQICVLCKVDSRRTGCCGNVCGFESASSGSTSDPDV